MRAFILKKRLCKIFCPYYKPSKSNQFACKGFTVVEKLLQEGKKIIFLKSEKVPNRATEEMLVYNMCITCPFYEKDCDFIQHGKNSSPCGGFRLLVQLLESNSITLDDIIRNSN
jgi:hypothetical protein